MIVTSYCGLFLAATEGSYVVFYMGATDLPSHDYFDCYKVIVQGNVLIHFKMVYHYISFTCVVNRFLV